jgi:hypothetical protein
MYENQFDQYEQIEYAKRRINIGKESFMELLLLIELVWKIEDHNQTIDIEFH